MVQMPFAEVMGRIARPPHPVAEGGNAVGLQPLEARLIAALEHAVGLGDTGAGAVLPGEHHGPARGAGAGRDGMVAQHHGVPAQPDQAGEELGEGVRVVHLALEAQNVVEFRREPALRAGETREPILIAHDQQDVGPFGGRCTGHGKLRRASSFGAKDGGGKK